jgi:hypothetical protein
MNGNLEAPAPVEFLREWLASEEERLRQTQESLARFPYTDPKQIPIDAEWPLDAMAYPSLGGFVPPDKRLEVIRACREHIAECRAELQKREVTQ